MVIFLYHFDEILVEVRMLEAMCNCIDHCLKDALFDKKILIWICARNNWNPIHET